MTDTVTLLPGVAHDDPDLDLRLAEMDDAALDRLSFGVIAFDATGAVRRYNRFESTAAGLSPQKVVGHDIFTVVAPCMNNFMVAQRFEDARDQGTVLDETIDYVLTLRMRPVKVRLRLLSRPGADLRYVLVRRHFGVIAGFCIANSLEVLQF